jgi:hypothetical protein
MPVQVFTPTVTIASGQTKSNAVHLRGNSLLGFALPSTFDGTEVSFEVSQDGSTFYPLYDEDGDQILLTVAASRAYEINAGRFAAWTYMKFVAGTAQATTDTVIPVGIREV